MSDPLLLLTALMVLYWPTGILANRHRYGIAFDDGALNRVAREGEDDGELQKLELFLFGSGSGYGESLKRV